MILTDDKVRSITKLYNTLLYSKLFVRPVVQLVVQQVVQQAAVCRRTLRPRLQHRCEKRLLRLYFGRVFTFLTFFNFPNVFYLKKRWQSSERQAD